MYHWRWRAFDKSERVHSGVIRAIDEPHAVLELRQRLMQVFELVDIDAEEYARESKVQARLNRWRGRVAAMSPDPVVEPGEGYAHAPKGPEPRVTYPPVVDALSRGRPLPIRHIRLIVMSALLVMLTLLLLSVGKHLW